MAESFFEKSPPESAGKVVLPKGINSVAVWSVQLELVEMCLDFSVCYVDDKSTVSVC